MTGQETNASGAGDADLERIVAENDLGGRNAGGLTGQVIAGVAIAWALFQLWYASPLPFLFGVFVLNDTEARSIHLALALFLTYTAYPALKSSPRDRVPLQDWALALAGAFAGAYLFLFYQQLALRPGQPTTTDLVTAGMGIVLLLEATRRSLGLPMVVVACVFLAYTFAGPYMPEALQHKGSSIARMLNHQWLVTEGVFGIALGVSTSFVFLFVLFGTLLERAGGGNWMMQISIALLGHLRGGPAKVAVVSSGLTGLVSGSSVSNVVSTGLFTIPLMKRTGLSGVKAGAIEASSSINGQIMPPVMGAAAFLMVEYVGIPYVEIIKHAFLPAAISYLSLFYIVHLEAVKLDAPLLPREERPLRDRLISTGIGLSGTILAICLIYFAIVGIQSLLGRNAAWGIAPLAAATYAATIWYSARFPDLKLDDPNAPIIRLPRTWEVARTGLDFVLPLGVLLWCLVIEQMSPGLSAFWGCVTVLGLLMTRKPLLALFRQQDIGRALRDTVGEVMGGLEAGSRNMIGIAIATATAGIIVGTVTLTGLGLMMTEFVEFVSGGNVILMLIFVALTCLILGMGIPTTANYILVATLMAPVVVELGAQAGIAIPLIAVHLFVFYFGIMADVTPPVGLASFAASAISRENPLSTGIQAATYSLRTAILPFVFIFNPEILLIGITSWGHMLWVVFTATLAILVFSMATMGWFLTKNRIWESAVLLVICFTLFRPGWWLDQFYDSTTPVPASELATRVEQAPANARMTLVIEGINIEGSDVRRTVSIPLGPQGDARTRLRSAGVNGFANAGDRIMLTNVGFGSYAARVGMETGFSITNVLVPAERPSRVWPATGALAMLGLIALLQWRRRRPTPPQALKAAAA